MPFLPAIEVESPEALKTKQVLCPSGNGFVFNGEDLERIARCRL